ncbi:MAG: rhodanese-like domain-containing protein [Pseudomonadota bacterium]
MNRTADIARCDVPTLAQRIESAEAGAEDFVLLDVRESWEREIVRLDPCLAIVMNDVPDRLDEIRRAQGDRDLIVFCHTGKRSLVVARFLADEGFDRLISLNGGIDAWSEHNHSPRHQY